MKNFINRWKGKGDEKSDTHTFWLDLLHTVFGLENPGELIEFEKRVGLKHVSYIDAYIPSTKVLIEQKSQDVPLAQAAAQSDGKSLTPFEQAKRYSDWLPVSQHARWIILCNFKELWIYDMEKPKADPEVMALQDLTREKLKFLISANNEENVAEYNTINDRFYSTTILLHFTEHRFLIFCSIDRYTPPLDKQTISVRLDRLFKHISLRLTGKHSLKGFIYAVSSYKKGYYVDTQDALIAKNQYEQLGLIRSSHTGKAEVIELTPLGRKIMNELNLLES